MFLILLSVKDSLGEPHALTNSHHNGCLDSKRPVLPVCRRAIQNTPTSSSMAHAPSATFPFCKKRNETAVHMLLPPFGSCYRMLLQV